MEKYSFTDIDDVFNKRQYVHFMTLKPPKGVDRAEEIIKFMNYLLTRKITFWLVECDSESEYRHFHGIVSYPDDTRVEDMEKKKSSFQRKVNRDIGFCYPLQKVQNTRHIYNYIHGASNTFIREWLTDLQI